MHNISNTNIHVEIFLQVTTNNTINIFPIPLVATYPVSWELTQWLKSLIYSEDIEFAIISKVIIIHTPIAQSVYIGKGTKERWVKEGRSKKAIISLEKIGISELPF